MTTRFTVRGDTLLEFGRPEDAEDSAPMPTTWGEWAADNAEGVDLDAVRSALEATGEVRGGGGAEPSWLLRVARPVEMRVVTQADLRALRREAAAHGDPEQVAECDRALGGDRAAWAACVEVIAAAADRRANG